jgi:hypothetical protein
MRLDSTLAQYKLQEIPKGHIAKIAATAIIKKYA